ncbi:MAG: hypothetical protein V4502_07520 [Pseudomonadota bacterium]
MPHRRPRKRGSFGGHFDELVEHFPKEEKQPPEPPKNKPPTDSADVHKRLFECAWRASRASEEGRRR